MKKTNSILNQWFGIHTIRGFISALMAAMLCAVLVVSMSGCGEKASVTDERSATATSAADFGGMDGLVNAAKAEGQINVIALPDDWSNWGVIIDKFQDTYGIQVNSMNPEASSAEEIKAAKDLKGQENAPDVFDLGPAVATANTDCFAPYKVQAWDQIPEQNKHKDGLYVNDYTGVMSIGYDAAKVPAPESLDDLLGPAFKGKVALNGDPTQAGAAFAAVGWATLQEGGSLGDFSTGINFFRKLSEAGNFLTVDATSATVASGETPVVIDWNYLNIGNAKQNPNFKTVVLPKNAYGSYYNQAINKDAPHPAAARLWQEFVYSPEVQNEFLKAGAFPVLAQRMIDDGTIDTAALEAAGGLPENIQTADEAQIKKANELLAKEWSAVAAS